MTKDTSLPKELLCPYCKHSITVPWIKFGAKEQCPHCNLGFVVSHRLIPQGPRKIDLEDEGGEYSIQQNIPVSPPPENTLSDAKSREPIQENQEEDSPGWRPMQVPSLELFLKGTFSFPFSIKSRGSLIVLMILCFAMFTMADSFLYYLSLGDPFSKFSGMISSTLSVVLGIVVFITFPAFAISILCDAAEGFEDHVTMRLDWAFAWIEEPAYIIVNLFWGSTPASMLLLLLPDFPGIKRPIYLLSEMIFFPVFLLSALASRSSVMPYSKPVWQSIWRAWHAWLLFYLLTILMGESFIYFWQAFPHKDFWTGIIVLSTVFSFFWIVYFRLLGRLALFCSGHYDDMHPPEKNHDISRQEEK